MSLDELRQAIDETDEQLVKLLCRRVDIAREVGRVKSQSDSPVYDPAREARLIRRIIDLSGGAVPVESLRAIYREIISTCRAVQTLRVAYLGPPYTNTYLAAVRHFGSTSDLRPCRSVEEIFAMTERGDTQVGLVPIENSLNGVVGETCDELIRSNLRICAETLLPVHHALLARCSQAEITVVYSHPQVFAQCREWLRENLAEAEQVAMSSTATASDRAAHEATAAALAPAIAADAYGLNVIAENIEDRPDNRTRFFVVGPDDAAPTGQDKTSIVFSLAHRAGSLHQALAPLHEHGINMTLIQSRPSRDRLWEYVFFVDFEGHRTEAKVRQALSALEAQGIRIKVLGSYPAPD